MCGNVQLNGDSVIDAVQAAVERLPQIDLPLKHQFAHGMYIRTIYIPKGAIIVGKVHRFEHPFVLTKGKLTVYDNVNGAQDLLAGHLAVSPAGVRRFAYAHEDTEWTTFHATLKTNLQEIEFELIEPRDFDRDSAFQNFMSQMKGQIK